MDGSYIEKLNFIEKHAGSIKPVVTKPELVDKITRGHEVNPEDIQDILRESETRVFVYEKEEAEPNSKKILLEAAEPLAFATVSPLIERLMNDPRCRSICVLADNVAAKELERKYGTQLTPIRSGDNKPMISDIPGLSPNPPTYPLPN